MAALLNVLRVECICLCLYGDFSLYKDLPMVC